MQTNEETSANVMRPTVAPTQHQRTIGAIVTVASIMIIAGATLVPQPDMAEMPHFGIISGALGGVDAILNIALFVPLGVGMAMLGLRPSRAILSMAVFSGLIETAQLFIVAGRDASAGDVLANTVGGVVGVLIVRYFWRLLSPSRASAIILTAGAIVFWLVVQTVVSFSLTRSFPVTHYYGQLAREFANLSTFEGRVIAAKIDTIDVPDFGYSKSEGIRDALDQGAVVTAIVEMPQMPPPPKLAPIIRVDSKGREMVLLAQHGHDLVFGVRTKAELLRLRPPRFALPGVFASGPNHDGATSVDTLLVSGQYDDSFVDLRAESGRSSRERRIAISAMLGWTLFAPVRWYVTGGVADIALSIVWMLLLPFPIGYWAVFVADGAGPLTRRAALPWCIGAFFLLAVGLVAIPFEFASEVNGRSVAAGWLVAFAGMAVGAVIAARVRKDASARAHELETIASSLPEAP